MVKPSNLDNVKEEICNLENYIDRLHNNWRSIKVKERIYFTKVAESWLRFFFNSQSVLGLNFRQFSRLQELYYLLITGVLNDIGHEKEIDEIAQLKLEFDKLSSASPSDKTNNGHSNKSRHIAYMLVIGAGTIVVWWWLYSYLLGSLR